MNPDNPTFRTPEEEKRAEEYVKMTKERNEYKEALETTETILMTIFAAVVLALLLCSCVTHTNPDNNYEKRPTYPRGR